MICNRCHATITGETAVVGEPMCAAHGYEDDYLLLVTCACGATHSIRMWQSEEAALEDWLETERELARAALKSRQLKFSRHCA